MSQKQRRIFSLTSLVCLIFLWFSYGYSFTPPQQQFESAKNELQHGSVERGIERLRNISHEFPKTIWFSRSMFLIGKTHYDRDEYQEAARAFQRISDADYILSDYTHYLLGNIYLGEKDYAKAVLQFARILGLYPASNFSDDSAFLLAESLYNMEDYRRSAEHYKTIVDRFPSSPYFDDAYLKLGQSLEKNKQRWEALSVYNEILLKYPQTQHYMKIRSTVNEMTGKTPEKLFEFTLQKNSERVSILLQNRKYTRALFILINQMLPESSSLKQGEIYAQIGICKFHLQSYDSAVDAFLKAIELGHGETVLTAHYYLARIFFRRDDEEKFFKHSNILLVSGTQLEFMDKVLYNLGSFYERKKEFSKAIGYWRKLADEYPSSTLCDDALWHLAWSTYCRRQYSKALEAMENMEQIAPGSEYLPQILFWKGKIFEKLKRYQEAYRSYHKTAHFFPYTYYGTMAHTQYNVLVKLFPEMAKKTGPFEYFENPAYKLNPMLMDPEKHREVIQSTHYAKGMELLLLGFKSEAITEFDAYESETELDLALKFHIADLYIASEDYYRGIRTLSQIVRDERIFGYKIIPDQIINQFFPSRYRDLILTYARKQDLDPHLIAGMILQESAFNEKAVSSAGARGLMQLMPGTAKWLMRGSGTGAASGKGLNALFDPEFNISLGTRYIKMLLKAFPGQDYLAIASYNAGKGNVEKWLKNLNKYPEDEFIEMIPFSETQGFVKHVLRNRERFRMTKIFEE